MNIQHEQNGNHGEFFLSDENGDKIAWLSYFFVDKRTIDANHTYVSEALRGQGVADELYRALSGFIRENNLNLIPTCSYIARKWKQEK